MHIAIFIFKLLLFFLTSTQLLLNNEIVQKGYRYPILMKHNVTLLFVIK